MGGQGSEESRARGCSRKKTRFRSCCGFYSCSCCCCTSAKEGLYRDQGAGSASLWCPLGACLWCEGAAVSGPSVCTNEPDRWGNRRGKTDDQLSQKGFWR